VTGCDVRLQCFGFPLRRCFAPAALSPLIMASRLSFALARDITQMGSALCSVSTVQPSKYVVRGMEALMASRCSHTVSGFSGPSLQTQGGHTHVLPHKRVRN
jgi:hypothetical protein